MKKQFLLILSVSALLSINNSSAQVSGTVYQDFNANGLRSTAEPLLSGVTVRLTRADGAVFTTITSGMAMPNYSFSATDAPAGSATRVEFIRPAGLSSFTATSIGADNASAVQFHTAPATLANCGFNVKGNYSSETDPDLFLPQHFGRSDAEAISGTYPSPSTESNQNMKAMHVFKHSYTGTTPISSNAASYGQTGTTWGLAFHKQTNTLFASAFYRPYGGFGPAGQSGIYKIRAGADGNFGTADDEVNTYVDFDVHFGANSTGPSPYSATYPNGDSTLVAKISFGDIEMSNDGNTLFAVNLFDRKIYMVNITTDLFPPTSGGVTVSTQPIPSNLRPFGIKQMSLNGKVYVGAVSETTGELYVWGYNPVTDTWDATYSFYNNPNWQCCPSNWNNTNYERGNLLTGVEIDPADNRLIINFVLRETLTGAAYRNAGELVAGCWNGSGWAVENFGQLTCSTPAITGSKTSGVYGPGGYGIGGEFYDDNGIEAADAQVEGASLQIPGSENIITVYDDPFAVYSAGVRHLSNANGSVVRQYEATPSLYAYPPEIYEFDGKKLSLGDLEYLSDAQPIQVGNRIWLDDNGDGIQNPDETAAGVPAGTVVTLRSPGIDGIYGNADDQTWTTTTDANGNYNFSNLTGGDVRQPATWSGVNNTLLAGYSYRIEVTVPGGYELSATNSGANDQVDNDATAAGSLAVVGFFTTSTDHSFDIGIKNTVASVEKLTASALLSGVTATVKWESENEYNTSHFIVERSINGRDWVLAGNTHAAGNHQGTLRYQLNDNVAGLSGVVYYRVKSVEINGGVSYSNIVTVKIAENTTVSVWPNPFTDLVSISIKTTLADKLTVKLTDASGRVISQRRYNSSMGNNQFDLDGLDHLTRGTYFLYLYSTTNSKPIVKKLVKK